MPVLPLNQRAALTMIKVTINGVCHEFTPGITILEATRQLGLNLPTFCNHQLLKPVASCRVCLVEIEGVPRLQPSCATLITDGMVVNTDGDRATQARQSTIKLLLANHPLDCPICDKGGECELQDTVLDHGPRVSYFEENKRVFTDKDPILNKVIIANSNRCIQCQRCVRVCDEVVGASAIGVIGRGADCIETGFDNNLNSCDHCGNCIEVCPVGALMRVEYRYKARPWDLITTDTICPHCGTGCQISAETRNKQLVRVKAKPTSAVNKELLCTKGRFGIDFVDKAPQITQPMVRKNNDLQAVSWNEALAALKENLQPLIQRGASAAGVISARMTNEVLFRFHQFINKVFASEQIYCGNDIYRHDFQPGYQHALNSLINQSYTNKPVSELFNSDCIFVLGCNIGEQNPVSEYLLRSNFTHQPFTLLLASTRQSRLDLLAKTYLRYPPGHELALLQQLILQLKNVQRVENDQPTENRDTDTQGIDGLQPVSPELKDISEKLASTSSISLLIGSDLLTGENTTATVHNLVQLIKVLQQITPDVSLQFLFQHCNGLGALDIASNWPGPTQALATSPAFPDILYVVDQELPLTKPQLMIYQGAFVNSTMEMADIVLPGFSFAETDGTFTNNEGRIQRVRPFDSTTKGGTNKIGDRINSNSAKYDAEIFSLVAHCLEQGELGSSEPQRIFDEISQQLSAYQGLDWDQLDSDLAFRNSVPAHPIKHQVSHQFSHQDGEAFVQPSPLTEKERELVSDITPESEAQDDNSQPFLLLTASSLYHSKDPIAASSQLDDIETEAWIEIHEHDASKLRVSQNEPLLVHYQTQYLDAPSSSGQSLLNKSLILPARITRRATKSTLVISGDLTKLPNDLAMSPTPTPCLASVYRE
ncbi:4Fe-4S dicluster domain-containing protein [Photobacterium alginatilyticum]|uniref:NADH-quinone oxidoreductase subunit G n=2 Tax=Photobacterium alginatilyticum TaxID=1775171 RepID=A0ABW9YM62_9GAMM|nr:4Fe-4S dicluster domain-containing protein [Photobacterium alginatilyticum]